MAVRQDRTDLQLARSLGLGHPPGHPLSRLEAESPDKSKA
jgi:hypothetical protein